MKYVKIVLVGLTVFPMTVIFFLFYAHIVSFVSPFISILALIGFSVVLLSIIYWFVVNMKDFILSIFKKNDEVDKKGFKKHF